MDKNRTQAVETYVEPPIMGPGHTFGTITDKISSIVLTTQTPLLWFAVVGFSLILLGGLGLAVTYLFYKGVGIWGINIPIGWGFAIVNFVWWVGIGHAGTLISAILLLLRQSWRNSINRFAEAMTLFAVMCAGMFPVLHMGRPWLAYWLFPYPNTMNYWPQFRSPLVWDVFAVSTYFTISLVYWYIGLVPDLATMRDKAHNVFAKMIYGMLALGWRGSARHWHRYEKAYLLLGGLATPLVLSVHTVVSFDFTVGIIPGWHSTFFPPYFVAGAIYSGFAMVLVLAIPIRSIYNLKDMITDKHLENCAKFMLGTGLIVAYGYVMEAFFSWYGTSIYEKAQFFIPAAWILCGGILDADCHKRWIRECALDQESPDESADAVPGFGDRVDRHVARAFRDRSDEPGARLPDLKPRNLYPDKVGLDDVLRHARIFLCRICVVYPRTAHDFDL